jgi:hypothetical protein
MKRINEAFEEKEFKRLKKKKGKQTWHDFIMTLVPDRQREVSK